MGGNIWIWMGRGSQLHFLFCDGRLSGERDGRREKQEWQNIESKQGEGKENSGSYEYNKK